MIKASTVKQSECLQRFLIFRWSFGVLLWEVMTFGGTPYSCLAHSEKLYEFLKAGNRLEQPEDCPEKM